MCTIFCTDHPQSYEQGFQVCYFGIYLIYSSSYSKSCSCSFLIFFLDFYIPWVPLHGNDPVMEFSLLQTLFKKKCYIRWASETGLRLCSQTKCFMSEPMKIQWYSGYSANSGNSGYGNTTCPICTSVQKISN